MAERTVDQPLAHLPGVIAAAENEWARNFAKVDLAPAQDAGLETEQKATRRHA